MDQENHYQKVSVLIPCFNEASTIAALVKEISVSPHVGEIIVIDDASTDETSLQARAAGAKVFTLKENLGKAAAMQHGVNQAQYSTILFVDGDMAGIFPNVIRDLVTPVTTGGYEMFVGIRRRNSLLMNTAIRFLPLLSGLRAMKKQFWMNIPDTLLNGFGVETVLNYFARMHKCKVGYIIVPGVHHKIKEDKYGLLQGLRRRFAMIVQICKTWWRLYLLRQLDHVGRSPIVEPSRQRDQPFDIN